MVEHADERDHFIEKIAAAIAADGFLFGLARDTVPGAAASMTNTIIWQQQLYDAKRLTALRDSYRQMPQLWASRKWGHTLGQVSGGGLVAGSGLLLQEYVFDPIVDSSAPGHHVFAYGIAGLGIGGGALMAISGVVALWVPKLRFGRRTAVWHEMVDASAIRAVKRGPVPATTTVCAADVRHALDDLLAEWATYRLDVEAWYLTKPLLHDVTGTVETTVAYETALQDLADAVEDLYDGSTHDEIVAASALADRAWSAWHDANDYAARVGLGDRTPTERAALQRLSKLVTRLTRSAADDPELPAIKRDIQTCLDKITTVAVSWTDIAALPAVERAELLRQLTPTTARGA